MRSAELGLKEHRVRHTLKVEILIRKANKKIATKKEKKN